METRNAIKNQLARINRRLSEFDRKICTSRSWREVSNLGRFHIVNPSRDMVTFTHVKEEDLGKMERKLLFDPDHAVWIR